MTQPVSHSLYFARSVHDFCDLDWACFVENCDLVALETGSSVENLAYMEVFQSFWLVRSSVLPRHMGRPRARLAFQSREMSQTHGSGIVSNFQNTSTYPKLFSTNHGSMMFLDVVIR